MTIARPAPQQGKPLTVEHHRHLAGKLAKLRREESGRLHGFFYSALGELLLNGRYLTANSVAQVMLTICAKMVNSKGKWLSQSDERLPVIAGVSRATWRRWLKTWSDAGLIWRSKDEAVKYRLNTKYFNLPKDVKLSARFGQFQALLATRILKDQWVARNPAGSRILLVLLSAIAAERRKAGVLYWVRCTREEVTAFAPMGTSSFSTGMNALLNPRNPLIHRHPMDRCLYLVDPGLFKRGGNEDIPKNELTKIPPPGRTIRLESLI